MLNRRAFVQRLGIGTVGSLSLLETSAQSAALAMQNGARRAAIPADAIRIGSNENPNGPTASAIDAARLAVTRRPSLSRSRDLEAHRRHHQGPRRSGRTDHALGRIGRPAARRGARVHVEGARPGHRVAELRTAGAAGAAGGVPVHEVPLTADLKLDLAPMLAKSGGSGLVYICNPNNPTSTIVPSAACAN